MQGVTIECAERKPGSLLCFAPIVDEELGISLVADMGM
jgi:hypothetical protein